MYYGNARVEVKPGTTAEHIDEFINSLECDADWNWMTEGARFWFQFNEGSVVPVDSEIRDFAEEHSASAFIVFFTYEEEPGFDVYGPDRKSCIDCEIEHRNSLIAEEQLTIEQLKQERKGL